MKNILKNRFNVGLKFVYSDDDSLSIVFQSNTVLSGVVGEFNNNVKELEKITKTNIYTRGNSISVKGNQENITLIKNAIKFLTEQFVNNGTIESQLSFIILINLGTSLSFKPLSPNFFASRCTITKIPK